MSIVPGDIVFENGIRAEMETDWHRGVAREADSAS